MPTSVWIYLLIIIMCLNFAVSIYSTDFDSCVFCIVAFTDCPGPQSDSAGKSDACEGLPKSANLCHCP
jgi:hypothetical protein